MGQFLSAEAQRGGILHTDGAQHDGACEDGFEKQHVDHLAFPATAAVDEAVLRQAGEQEISRGEIEAVDFLGGFAEERFVSIRILR